MNEFMQNPTVNNKQYMQDLINYNQIPPSNYVPSYVGNYNYNNSNIPNANNCNYQTNVPQFAGQDFNNVPNMQYQNNFNNPLNNYNNTYPYNLTSQMYSGQPNINYNNQAQFNNVSPINTLIANNPNYLESMYPDLYKIIRPVITKVIITSNLTNFNEDTLNRLSDTVIKIVDGDVNYAEELEKNKRKEQELSQSKLTSQQTSNQSMQNNNNNNMQANTMQNKISELETTCFKDLKNLETKILNDTVKILIINELKLISRNV